jgi:hypothetical protein
MSSPAPQDPTVLEPSHVSLHQLVTFAAAGADLVQALEESPLFHVERLERAARGEWMQLAPENDPSSFPFGRVCLYPHGMLLEAFSGARIDLLRGRLEELGAGRITADEIRVFRIAHALVHPERLHQPLHELVGEELTRREVALSYLRMAWPFLPREDLGGRTPHAALRTGRGRAAVDRILDGLPRELRRDLEPFPAFSADTLRAILLPEEDALVEAPARERQPAWERRPT